MPETQRPEYNPLIMGFVKDHGPVIISLKKAREVYGKLPSEYQLVSRKNSRRLKKALNLDIGKIISARLKSGQVNLKKTIIDFFGKWHRSYEDEFGIHITPFLNLNDPANVRAAVTENKPILMPMLRLDVRDEVGRFNLIRRDVLNSIPQDRLAETVLHMLGKKNRQLRRTDRAEKLRESFSKIQSHSILQSLKRSIGLTEAGFSREMLDIHADEIAAALHHISRHMKLEGIGRLQVLQGQGVELQFAARDGSYLALGKQTGDCTADKPLFQADQDVENIYWTVFPWILDRNYQILKVSFNGEFIMKAHILPLFWISPQGERMILAVDAIETGRAFRDDLEGRYRADLMTQRGHIFRSLLEQIRAIAYRMGIHDVYAEKFSNTPWVRSELCRLPEILINVHQLIKLDELEDVFELSRMLSEGGSSEIQHVFMELQMKNTSLLPGVTKRMEAIKSFAVVHGNPAHGIPMKRVIGI
ncbi:MAG: hypothetical protein C4519_15970 [Desulfobacteraceae bacterium]|nr:MAG: hypothetical protein C4519_15970 [Desulfobacteraceae bacterium]